MKKYTIKFTNGTSVQTNNPDINNPVIQMLLKANKTKILEVVKNF